MSRMDGERRERPGKGDAPDEVEGNSCCAQMNTPEKVEIGGRRAVEIAFTESTGYLPNVSLSVWLTRFPLNRLPFRFSPTLSIGSS